MLVCMDMRSLFTGIIFLLASALHAQHIDPYSTLFEIPDSSYIRLSYDNDFFQGHDFYYTQGFSFDGIFPVFRKNPVNKVLFHDRNADYEKYGLRIESDVYTPTDISADSILTRNHPYSAVAYLEFFRMSYAPKANRKVSSALDIGIIGPAALGKEMQTGIHEALNMDPPQGWQYQIQNEPFLNYTLRLEQQVLESRSRFSAGAIAEVRAGNYLTEASLGIELSVGRKNNLFTGTENKIQWYFYSQSYMHAVGYDATLEGGLFNRNSQYIISQINMEPLVAEQHIGFVVSVPHVYASLDFGFITQRFMYGRPHGWGGIRLCFF